jgi:puromycin-sensitive aminopeptidase
MFRLFAAIAFLAVAHADDRLPDNVIPERYALTIATELETARFSGREMIDVRVATPAREVTLHAVGLDIGAASVSSAGTTQPAEVRFDAAREQMTLKLAQPISGKAQIVLEWKGALNKKMAGFFLVEDKGKRYAFTQFEPVDARRMFPCFDEPALKARFALTAVIDASLNAVSNGSIESERSDGKKKTIRFTETAPMSSYLVALGVGPLGEIKDTAGKVPLRVVAPRDQVELGRYALDVAKKLLPRFETWFGIPYPFGKLDLVALPQSFGGAMENTGAIFFRDVFLLLDPKTASVSQKQYVALTIAHEMAHQWFGDLVTMRWWDDLWLNEAFATWAEMRFADPIWPEWDLFTDFHNWVGKALSMDQLPSTHPIRTPISSPAEANEAFDAITYSKGAAVLRMLEQYLGEEPFRRGVAAYLQSHKYGNTQADDLWLSLAAETRQPVGEIARAWTDLPGVPLVTVAARCENGKSRLTVEQQRFLLTRPDAAAQQNWPIPLCLRSGKVKKCQLVREPRTELQVDGCGPIVANAGETGYYRVKYDPAMLKELTAAHAQLTAAERIGLVRDQWALVRQGAAGLGSFLDLVMAMRGERARAAVVEQLGALEFLDDHLVAERDRARLQAVVAQLFLPGFNELGWDARPGEADESRLLRGLLLRILGHTARLPAIGAEVEVRLQRYLKDPASLDGAVADEVVRLAALNGNAERWEDFRKRAREAKTPDAALRFRYALAGFEDPALVERTLQLSLSDEVPAEDTAMLVAYELLYNRRGRDPAWGFVRKHFAELRQKTPDFRFSRLILSLGQLCDPAAADGVQKFFAEHKVAAADKRVDEATTSIRLCSDLKKREAANLSSWLRAAGDRL